MSAAAGAYLVGRPKRSVPPPEERGDRETIIHLKGSPEYVDWLEAAHKRTHISKAQIVRLALADWATKMGLPTPPEI
jgi:hypothetical protein